MSTNSKTQFFSSLLASGHINWVPSELKRTGLYTRSLCEHCNNTYGRIYGPAYVDFVRQIAERIGDVDEYHRLQLSGVRWPLRILKQVMLQFVTANGSGFVRAKPWVAPFVRDRLKQGLPDDVCVYLFATNQAGGRTTGIAAHLNLELRKSNTMAEFTFWPLGTVVSLDGEIEESGLSPIHHWANYRFDDRANIDIELIANPVATANPLDFRTQAKVIADGDRPHPSFQKPSDEEARRTFDKAIRLSGGDDEGFRVVGHPSVFRDDEEAG